MQDLIEDVFLRAFDDPSLFLLEDQARFDLSELSKWGDRLAVTTDSYVLSPLEIPGADIGSLAVCGTINDLAVGGAKPLYLTVSVILEEGLEIATLRRIAQSMATTARSAGVRVVTGDTKVVERGAADQVFINTSGVGVIREGIDLGLDRARIGDAILVNGFLGDHGAAVLNARGSMALDAEIRSDSAPLNGMIDALLDAAPETRFLRDATRGGVAAVLNEIAERSGVQIEIADKETPIRTEIRGFCEILGFDPLYLANEGKIVAVVPDEEVSAALEAMKKSPYGQDCALIGRVIEGRPGRVVMKTAIGGRRIVDRLVGEQLPRIC